jgi:hypothetical protein
MDVLDSDFDIDSSEGEQEEIEEGHKVDSELRREERQVNMISTAQHIIKLIQTIGNT